MLGINYKISKSGYKPTIIVLKDTGKFFKERKKIFEKVVDDVFYPEIKKVFDFGGIPQWKPLSDNYSEWKNKHYPGKPILVLSGKMKDSLTKKHAEGSYLKITNDVLEIGSKLKDPSGRYVLAELHHRGTRRLPKRQVFSREVLKNILELSKKKMKELTKEFKIKNWGKRGRGL